MSLSRVIYSLLVMVSAYAGYYLYERSFDDIQQVAPSLEAPIFTGQHLYNTSYDVEGTRNYSVYSDSLEHFAQSGDTVFYQPKLIVYREGKLEEWIITSDQGLLNKDNELTLTGNIIAKNTLPESNLDTMTTELMVIDLSSKDFSSDQKVTMVGPKFMNVGNAITGNFDANVATLFNQVKGKYETLAP